MRTFDEDEIKLLMNSDEYLDSNNSNRDEVVNYVSRSWENLYPEDDRNTNPENYYVWRCVGDDKTRTTHAERDGQVFAWDNPPEGGHPGEDYNCRCWAEDYEPPLSRMHESQEEDYEYLSFDGRELKLYRNGEKIKSWEAMSGQAEYQCDEYQSVADKGPLPEGEWLVKQSNHQNFYRDQTVMSMVGGIFSSPLKSFGSWPGSLWAWGEDRIWLEPTLKTDIKQRGNFSIHGGDKFGSRGCIDIVGQMSEFVDEFKKYGKDMVLSVRYPHNSCW